MRMIDKVAAAIRKDLLTSTYKDLGDGLIVYDGPIDLKELAETVIEAMRENTPAMSEAMRLANMNIAGGYDGPSGWEAAIDAALKEPA